VVSSDGAALGVRVWATSASGPFRGSEPPTVYQLYLWTPHNPEAGSWQHRSMGLLRLSRRLAGSPHALIAALLIYGNGSAWLSTREGKEISLSFNWWHMAMLAGTLAWAAAERVSHREFGLAGDRVRGSIVLGSMLGGFIVALIRVLFLLPVVARRAWLPEFRGLTNLALLRALAAQFLFGSALFEEVAFRGLLHAKLTQAVGPAIRRLHPVARDHRLAQPASPETGSAALPVVLRRRPERAFPHRTPARLAPTHDGPSGWQRDPPLAHARRHGLQRLSSARRTRAGARSRRRTDQRARNLITLRL
jgi:hypothetical protein